MSTETLNGKNLDLKKFSAIIDKGRTVEISPGARKNITECRSIVEEIIENETVKYGINTGFGKFSGVVIDKDETVQLQKNIVLSHAVGVGDPVNKDIAKGVMLLKLNSFLTGLSGIRIEVADTLVEMINKSVIPYIPQKGSVGASGDLAPLSHMALVMTGQGKAYYEKELLDGREAMERAGISPLELQQKEGLAILNGTQVMTSTAAVSLIKAEKLLKTADITGCVTLESLRGTLSAFDDRIQQARPHRGQIITAQNFRKILKDSEIIKSHKKCSKVQDAYSLRCIPQVHGAVKDTYTHVRKIIETEMNSVTDNPLVFKEDHDVISGGNFHGEPVAFAADFLSIAISELASISERRVEYMLDAATNDELPAFLVEKGGINSGHMMTQVTAAALVSENKVLSHPASVDSIPTSSNKEDHVSMGTHAARKLNEIVDNSTFVITIELLCGIQALDFREPDKCSRATKKVYDIIRKKIPFMEKDRLIHNDIINLKDIISEGSLIEKTEEIAGIIDL